MDGRHIQILTSLLNDCPNNKMNAESLDRLEHKNTVVKYLASRDDPELQKIVDTFKPIYLLYQVYIDAVVSLRMEWRCFGISALDVSDKDYALAHLFRFKESSIGDRRVIVSYMQNMPIHAFSKESPVQVFLNLCK